MAINGLCIRMQLKRLPVALILLALSVVSAACAAPTQIFDLVPTATAEPDVPATSTLPLAPSVTSTLSATPTPEPTVPEYNGPTPAPTFDISLETISFGDLTIEETKLGPVTDENKTLYNVSVTDIFYARIPQGVFERHTPEFDYPKQQAEDTIREALSGFGYQLEGEYGAYKLYQGDTLLSDSVISVRSFQMSPSKTSFSMLVQLQNMQVWLLQKDRFDLYFDGAPRTRPAFAGENLLTTDIQYTETGIHAVVLREDEVIYTYPNIVPGPETCPIDFFRAWQDHWVLQVNGESIMDGEPVAAEAGYDVAFNWHLINNKPAYLFQKGDLFGISYDGKELPLTYDYVERWDCIYGTPFYPFGAHGRDNLLTFFAQRGGNWYFVQAGSFE